MADASPEARGERETARLEAFSDGVFAVAITLLVLDLKVPPAEDGTRRLGAALLDQWPAYLAYAGSFLSILIMWVNHHQMFRRIARVDHGLLICNGLLLMAVTVAPFSTSVLSAHIDQRDARVAAALYSGTFVVIALLWNLVWLYASRRRRLVQPTVDAAALARLTRRNLVGPPTYVIAFGLAFVSPIASVLFMIACALYWTLPGFSLPRHRARGPDALPADREFD